MTTVAKPRRVTPAGQLILTADTDRETWLDARKSLLCSSDMAAVLGVTEYATPLHVFHSKRSELFDDEAGEPAYWGTQFEDVVARTWCARNRSVIRRIGLISNIERPWMGATLDRLVQECPQQLGPCFLEVKCRSAFKAGQWNRSVPDDVMAQVVWAMAVGGFGHCHVAVLIGGNDYRQFTVKAEAELTANVVEAGRRFWEENVLAGVEPPVTAGYGDALAELYDRLHPDRLGNTHLEDLDSVVEVEEAAREYEEARLSASEAESRKKDARARLLKLLGDGENLILGDELAFSYSGHPKTSVNTKRLKELYPEAYADCRATTVVRTLRLAKKYKITKEN